MSSFRRVSESDESSSRSFSLSFDLAESLGANGLPESFQGGAIPLRIQGLSNEALHERTLRLVNEERRITTEVLEHLHEVERRKLFAEMGYSSLFAYVTEALKYSQAAAWRRIAAMRLLRGLPTEEKSTFMEALKDGRLSVSTISQVQAFIQQEKKEKGKTYSGEEKTVLFHQLEGTSSREANRLLATIAPKCAPRESERALNSTLTQICFTVDQELLSKLDRIRDLLGYQVKGRSYEELLERMADIVLKKIDPTRKTTKEEREGTQGEKRIAGANQSVPTAEVKAGIGSIEDQLPSVPAEFDTPKSRYISRKTVREIHRRDVCCTYVDRKTGKRCESTFGLTIEHLKPYALGGTHDPENLTLRCFQHNQLAARKQGLVK